LHENLAGRRCSTHKAKRGVISAGKPTLAKNSARVQQCRTREIIEGERNHWRFHLNPAGPTAKPSGKPALAGLGDVMPRVHARGRRRVNKSQKAEVRDRRSQIRSQMSEIRFENERGRIFHHASEHCSDFTALFREARTIAFREISAIAGEIEPTL